MRQRTVALLLIIATSALASMGAALASGATVAAGELDPSWATGGVSITPVGATAAAMNAHLNANAAAGLILPGGKLLLAGYTARSSAFPSPNAAVAIRLNADGTLDQTFNDDGIGYFDIADSSSIDAALLIGGQVYLVGNADVGATKNQVLVARLDDTGHLDPTYGGGTGYVLLSSHRGVVEGAIVGPDGMIYVNLFAQAEINILKLHTDGSTVNGFGSTGLVGLTLTGQTGGSAADGIAIDTAGHILVGGMTYSGADDEQFFTARLTAAGGLDSTYNGTGYAIIPGTKSVKTNPFGFSVDAQGRSLIGGRIGTSAATTAVLGRVLPSGTVDTSFGTGGLVTFPSTVTRATRFASAPSGQLYVAGGGTRDGANAIVTARLNDNGTLDPAFSGDGLAFYTTPFGTEPGGGVLPLADGSVYSLGMADDVQGPVGAVAVKYLGQPRTDAPTPTPTSQPAPTPTTDAAPAPGPAAAPVPAPVVKPTSPLTLLTVLSPRIKTVTGGKPLLTAKCAVACKITVTLAVDAKTAVKAKLEKAGSHKKPAPAYTLASATAQLASGGSLTLSPKAAHKAGKPLGKLTKLPVTATIIAVDGASGASFTTTQSLTLKR